MVRNGYCVDGSSRSSRPRRSPRRWSSSRPAASSRRSSASPRPVRTASRSPRSSATWRRPAPARIRRCCADRENVETVVLRGGRRRPGPVPVATTRASSAPPSGRCSADARAGRDHALDHGRQEGADATSASVATTSPSPSPASPRADLRGRPRRRRRTSPSDSRTGEYDQVKLAYTQFLSMASQRVVQRHADAARRSTIDAERRRGRSGARRARGRPPTTSSSPARTRSSTGCCPATPRPASSPRCSTPPRRSRPPASGP